MGIPIFFKVISTRYPSIMQLLAEIPSKEILQRSLNPSSSPYGWFGENYKPHGSSACDVLAIDLNGVVHPICHPEDRAAPSSEERMMLGIFDMIDRMVASAQPTKVLFIALDGVAPRAKMNQQRARRFAAASESKGLSNWDSNVITPGTVFQEKLGIYLRWYAESRLSAPGWNKNLEIVLSDSSNPGEGEHKIIDFIRQQRQQPGYDINTRTIVAGLDADLILLSLATHERAIKILREEQFLKTDQCFKCGSRHHKTEDCHHKGPVHRRFQVLDVWMLRKCLEAELVFLNRFDESTFGKVEKKVSQKKKSEEAKNGKEGKANEATQSKSTDLVENIKEESRAAVSSADFDMFGGEGDDEEALNDINENIKVEVDEEDDADDDDSDELSHPFVSSGSESSYPDDYSDFDGDSIDSEGGDDIETVEETNDLERRINDFIFLMCLVGNDFIPHLPNLELREGALDFIFNLYPKLTQKWNGEYLTSHIDGRGYVHKDRFADVLNHLGMTESYIFHFRQKAEKKKLKMMERDEKKNRLKNQNAALGANGYIPPIQSKEIAEDGVENWKEGWKERYYNKVLDGNRNNLDNLCQEWVNAMLFTLDYYYHGCPSWGWYFPYHYSPAASDVSEYLRRYKKHTQSSIGESNNSSLDEWISFDREKYPSDEPLHPLEQLMAVLPPSSSSALPKVCADLMVRSDSPLHQYYPNFFVRDSNGQPSNRKYLWTIVLPFIDTTVLKKEFSQIVEKQLSENEKRRNTNSPYPLLFISSQSHTGKSLNEEQLKQILQEQNGASVSLSINGDGITGSLEHIQHLLSTDKPPSNIVEAMKANINQSIGFMGSMVYPKKVNHIPKILPGQTQLPKKKLRRQLTKRIAFLKVDYDLLIRLGNDNTYASQYPAPKFKEKKPKEKKEKSKGANAASTQDNKNVKDKKFQKKVAGSASQKSTVAPKGNTVAPRNRKIQITKSGGDIRAKEDDSKERLPAKIDKKQRSKERHRVQDPKKGKNPQNFEGGALEATTSSGTQSSNDVHKKYNIQQGEPSGRNARKQKFQDKKKNSNPINRVETQGIAATSAQEIASSDNNQQRHKKLINLTARTSSDLSEAKRPPILFRSISQSTSGSSKGNNSSKFKSPKNLASGIEKSQVERSTSQQSQQSSASTQSNRSKPVSGDRPKRKGFDYPPSKQELEESEKLFVETMKNIVIPDMIEEENEEAVAPKIPKQKYPARPRQQQKNPNNSQQQSQNNDQPKNVNNQPKRPKPIKLTKNNATSSAASPSNNSDKQPSAAASATTNKPTGRAIASNNNNKSQGEKPPGDKSNERKRFSRDPRGGNRSASASNAQSNQGKQGNKDEKDNRKGKGNFRDRKFGKKKEVVEEPYFNTSSLPPNPFE